MTTILKFITVALLLLLASCTKKPPTKAQANNDSIKKYLAIAKNDTLDFKIRDEYNEKAFKLLDFNKNDSVLRWFLKEISYNNLEIGKRDKYKEQSKIHFTFSNKAKDTLGLARFYRLKAVFFKKSKIYDSAFFYYEKAEKNYLKVHNNDGLINVLLYKSMLQNNLNDYLGAEYTISKAYFLINKDTRLIVKYSIYVELGNIYHNLKNYNKAINFHRKSLTFAKKYNVIGYDNSNVIGTSLNNIGNVYREKKDYETAVFYFKEGLKENNLLKNDPESYAILLNNLGDCYINSNNYKGLPNLLIKAEKTFDSLNVWNEQSISNIYLSNYYCKVNDTLKAISYSNKALKIAKESKASNYYLFVLENAGKIEKKNASKYLEQYHKLSDSLLFEERKARSQFHKIQLETNEITKEKETAIHQKWVQMSIFIAVLTIAILLFVIISQRAKQKELQLLQDQQKANEEIYQLMLNQQMVEEEVKLKEKKRIALELHDNIMNKLASTRFNLFKLSKTTDQATIDDALIHIEKIKDIEDEIRDLTHDLTKEVFQDSSSYKSHLEKFIADQNKLHSTNYTLEIEADIVWEKISSKIKMHLYRIIQEAIHNINKHAQASKATIALILDEENICMSVQDNGIGFEQDSTTDGIGIKNMKHRLKLVNGKITIQSTKDNGTVLFLRMPLAQK
ncbi:tetratricopeptide repeat protein [Flavobacterium sp.]|uniref:ATP-binding protein n=1 Tax=Flavobacterium sp. TaxID=239 RepID=UPI003753A13D